MTRDEIIQKATFAYEDAQGPLSVEDRMRIALGAVGDGSAAVSERGTFYYRLCVGDGWYDANGITTLLWNVLKHRLWHLFRGDGWRD